MQVHMHTPHIYVCLCVWYELMTSAGGVYMLKWQEMHEALFKSGPTRSCHVMSVRILYMKTVLWKVAMRVFVGLMPVSFWLMLSVLRSRALSWVSISILKCWVAALPTSQSRDWEQTKCWIRRDPNFFICEPVKKAKNSSGLWYCICYTRFI